MPAKRLLSPPTSSPPLITSTPPSHSASAYSHALPLPNFLGLSRPQINYKFRLLAAHEYNLITAPSAFFAHHPTTVSRDRYADIRPWAHNRILLSSFEEPHDYINASPITLGRKERFIATQGPADDESGLEGFWRMAWQEGVQVVVMLTRCVESGREKCGLYFPLQDGEELEIGSWGRVECVSKKLEGGSEVRELRVVRKVQREWEDLEEPEELEEGLEGLEGLEEEEEEETMTIWHYLFTAWPDMDVPKTVEDQKALLELVRMTRDKVQGSESPRIVHCSAGVGRTGTFIALDHLLQEFKEGKWDALANGASDSDPIFDTVKKLRDQRMGLVYKVGQYAFIYQILKEKWEDLHVVKRPESAEGGHELEGSVLESPAKRRRLSEINDVGFGGDD